MDMFHPLPLVDQCLCQCLAIPNSPLHACHISIQLYGSSYTLSIYFTLSIEEVAVKIDPHTLC